MDGLPQPQRRWAVLAIALALIMAVLDSAIANIALPTIARDLHVTEAASIWVVNAYQLAGDHVRCCRWRRWARSWATAGCTSWGLALFVVASSLLCALSGTLPLLTLRARPAGAGRGWE